MNKVLVLCKGTGQSEGFKRIALEYVANNNIPVDWLFENDKTYLDIVKRGDIKVVLISPEMLLVEKKIKEELNNLNIPNLSLKPADFGLKRIEKIIPLIEQYFE